MISNHLPKLVSHDIEMSVTLKCADKSVGCYQFRHSQSFCVLFSLSFFLLSGLARIGKIVRGEGNEERELEKERERDTCTDQHKITNTTTPQIKKQNSKKYISTDIQIRAKWQKKQKVWRNLKKL